MENIDNSIKVKLRYYNIWVIGVIEDWGGDGDWME